METDKKYDQIDRIIEMGEKAPEDLPSGFLIEKLLFDHEAGKLIFILKNGLLLHLPKWAMIELKDRNPEELEAFELPGSGSIVHWKRMDLTISAERIVEEYIKKVLPYERKEWDKLNASRGIEEGGGSEDPE